MQRIHLLRRQQNLLAHSPQERSLLVGTAAGWQHLDCMRRCKLLGEHASMISRRTHLQAVQQAGQVLQLSQGAQADWVHFAQRQRQQLPLRAAPALYPARNLRRKLLIQLVVLTLRVILLVSHLDCIAFECTIFAHECRLCKLMEPADNPRSNLVMIAQSCSTRATVRVVQGEHNVGTGCVCIKLVCKDERAAWRDVHVVNLFVVVRKRCKPAANPPVLSLLHSM